jgi:transposase
MEELIAMSSKELDRLTVLQKVINKELKQKEAASLLRISGRQIRTCLKRLKEEGAKGVISRKRGQRGHRRKPDQFKQSVLALMKEKYEGFGPTFAKEKLEEWHGLKLSAETLRLWMIESHLWYPKMRKKQSHIPRARRPCFGELIQADGSHHHWFGDDELPANATVFIDDATSCLTSLVFSETEDRQSYFDALKEHLTKYGRPRALYTDRFSVFQTSNQVGKTQIQRALKELDIELIFANSPQAKGRVERANRILQDRLVKEFKLRGIKTIQEANLFAKEFIEIYNQKFSKEPVSSVNAHRSLEGYDLEKILCRLESRTLLSNCTFQFKSQLFKIQGILEHRRAKGRKIEIRIVKDGKMRVFLADKELSVIPLNQTLDTPLILSRKEVLAWKTKAHKQPPSHPWKKYGYQLTQHRPRKKYSI